MKYYLFDCDKTLYHFDFRKRLPTIAALTGATQYQMASTWWVQGYERAAEAGAYTTSDEYFEAFEQITGTPLTLEIYRQARSAAMTPNHEVIAAFERMAARGTVAMVSNNPMPFYDSIDVLVPEIVSTIGSNRFVSANLGVRKPDPLLYTRVLEQLGAKPDEAIFVDDSARNVEGARAVGMRAFHYTNDGTSSNGEQLNAALDVFTDS